MSRACAFCRREDECETCKRLRREPSGGRPPRGRMTRAGFIKKILAENGLTKGREVKGATAADLDLMEFQPIFTTVRRVPIVMAGVEYLLSTGPATFTPEDIQDFVTSQDDPAIVSPRLKIGHTSALSRPTADGILRDGDDGAPSLGKFLNITYDEPTMTAVGDIVGCPVWLARLMPLMFPNRSIEGFQEAETVSGHQWGLVVHAVALLGVIWPGCSTLTDLPLLYTEDGPDDIELYDEEGEPIDMSVKARVMAARGRREAAPAPVAAAVNVDDVRRSYYDSLNGDQYWWWIRAIYLDPNELVVDDDDGQLYRVSFTISGDEVEFSDPTPVRIQYVDAANSPSSRHLRAQLATALVSRDQEIAASYTSREESRPNPEQEASTMTRKQRIAALRARLGLTAEQLPDTATDEQLSAAVLSASESEEPAPGGGGSAEPEEEPEAEEPEVEEPETPGGAAPATAALPAGMVAVPASEWARVQAGAQAGLQSAERDEESRRDTTLAAACQEGRIRPSDVESYRNMHAAAGPSRDMFYQLLTKPVAEGGLAAGLVPVTERGEMPGGANAAETGELAAGYDPSWLNPQERARIAAVKDGTYVDPQVTTDDPRVKTPAAA